MLTRLRRRLVATTMVILTVMLAAIFGLVYHFTAENLERQSMSQLSAVANLPLGGSHPNDPNQPRIPYLLLQVDSYGLVTAASSTFYDLSDRESLNALAADTLAQTANQGVLSGYGLRYLRASTPSGVRLAFADISAETAVLQNLLRTCALIGGASLAAFLLLSMLLARWATRPMAEAWRQQRQFVADASHELKTPLTVIMTNAELLQAPGNTPAQQAQATASILTMAHQMRGLVEGLLELARSDNGQSQGSFALVDLSALVEESTLPFEALFFERGLTLECTVTPHLTLRGDAQQLRQVVEILLDNAQKYAVSPGTVSAVLSPQGHSHCLLTVSNPGPPIAAGDLKRIFQRFYRVDKARSRTGSFGLGLSIAQSIVHSHGGRIWAESSGGYNTCSVLLPLPRGQRIP